MEKFVCASMRALVKRIYFSLIILVFAPVICQAQFSKRFIYSTGFHSYLLETATKVSPVYAGGFTTRYNLWQPRASFSISFAVPLAMGIHIKNKILEQTFFFSDIPLMCEFNYGHLATRDFRKSFGVFVGGGYAFQSVDKLWQQGACLSGGFRFWFFKQSFTLRYARFFSGTNGIYSSHRIGIEFTLGRFVKDVHGKNKLSKFELKFQK